MPFHFGLDATYGNVPVNDKSFGLGLRYRFAFTGEKDYEIAIENDNDKYKFIHHRVALLANYRFHFDQFFVGPVLGIDIWKYFKLSVMNVGNNDNRRFEITSSQFLWNNITGQLGLEVGYKITDNLLVKLEAGYDLSSFGFSGEEFCKSAVENNALRNCNGQNPIQMDGTGESARSKEKLKLNAFYFTLGIGWFFG